MKIVLKALTLSLATAFLASTAIAGLGGHGKFMAFFDTNQDNNVTIEELSSASKNRFTKMDTDGNQSVSREEFSNHIKQRRNQRREKIYQQVDENSDEQISMDEFLSHKKKRAEHRFNRLDSNQDGFISPEEFTSTKHRHGKKWGHRSGKRMFSRLDANDDGLITQDESINAWTNWFNRIDNNRDKIVTLEEVQNFRRDKMKAH